MPSLSPLRWSSLDDAVTFGRKVYEWSRIVVQTPILNGQLLEVTFPGSANSVAARHSLGRAYVGAFVIGAASSHQAGYPRVDFPETAAAAGFDVTQSIVFGVQVAGDFVGTFRAWVF